MKTHYFKKGAEIIQEGMLSDCAYIIESGSVEVSKKRPNEDKHIIAVLKENDIFAYSRIKGLFAGLSFDGTIISSDKNANFEYYGEPVSNRNLLAGHKGIKVPESGQAFLGRMNHLAPPY